jgi:hypothetical protein
MIILMPFISIVMVHCVFFAGNTQNEHMGGGGHRAQLCVCTYVYMSVCYIRM